VQALFCLLICLFPFQYVDLFLSGNGWIDAIVQGPAVIDYSWYHGMIDAPTRYNLFLEWEDCLADYYEQMFSKHGSDVEFKMPYHPFNVQDECGIMCEYTKKDKVHLLKHCSIVPLMSSSLFSFAGGVLQASGHNNECKSAINYTLQTSRLCHIGRLTLCCNLPFI